MIGLIVIVLLSGGDCKLFFNVNDFDFYMEGREMLILYNGLIEMFFVLIRVEIVMVVVSNSNWDSYKIVLKDL